MKKFSRRAMIAGGTSLGAFFLSRHFQTQPHALFSQARADNVAVPKLIVIFLNGGWDSLLATDPVIGEKENSSSFEDEYKADNFKFTVPGKNNLIIGKGLEPALNGFANIPTAFVNGIFMEITGHELAAQYLYSGKESLSLSRDYPSIASVLGRQRNGFPPHVVIGYEPPLGDTAQTHPPLVAPGIKQLSTMLAGPKDILLTKLTDKNKKFLNPEGIVLSDEFSQFLNTGFENSLGEQERKSLELWNASNKAAKNIAESGYAARFGDVDAELLRYDLEKEESSSTGRLAAAWLVLKSGLSPYVTVNFGGFDTHDDHLSTHLPRMQDFAKGLETLIQDLRITPDPDTSGKTLAETTTILVTSEFVRSPTFNGRQGTDHWPSASAILMGRGVKDNTVLGRTGLDGKALGFQSGGPVPRTSQTALLPDHLIAAILKNFGSPYASEINQEGRLDGLFQA